MGIMHQALALLFLAGVAQCAPKLSAAETKMLTLVGPDWYCATICEGAGGAARYEHIDDVCHCRVSEHIDDGDMDLIRKTAATIGMPMVFNETKKKRASEDNEGKAMKQHALKLPLFAELQSRLHPAALARTEDDSAGPIVGQMDPTIRDTDTHHNQFGGLGGIGGLPLAPLVAPINSHVYPLHLTPALTRSLLMNVRDKLDNLIMHTHRYPYQPAVTAHETESMRNTLKQITQVNVNVRPAATTWGYFFNNLVNHLLPAGGGGLLGAESPNATMEAGAGNETESTTEEYVESSTTMVTKPFKGLKKVKIGSGKKMSVKTSTSTEATTISVATTIPTTATTSAMTLPETTTCSKSTTTPIPEFLPIEEDDYVVGEIEDDLEGDEFKDKPVADDR